jgi:hypothetical protein
MGRRKAGGGAARGVADAARALSFRYNSLDFLHAVFVRAMRIYLPVHLIPPLLFKHKYVMR